MSRPVSFNLVVEPFLPGVRDGATASATLVGAFTPGFTVATGDPLTDHAVHRLLTAITYAALGVPAEFAPERFDPEPVCDWLIANRDHFDVFAPDRPFAQDATLAGAPVSPVGVLDPVAAKDRPLFMDVRTMADLPPIPAGLAVLRLMRLMVWGSAGRTTGVSVSLSGCSLTGQAAFRAAGDSVTAAAWAWTPHPAGAGTASWTFTRRGATAKTPIVPTGCADGFAWWSRRALLRRDPGSGLVDGVALDQGWVRAADPVADAQPGRGDAAKSGNNPAATILGDGVDTPGGVLPAWWASTPGAGFAWWARTHGAPPPIIATGAVMNQSAPLRSAVRALPSAALTADPGPLLAVIKAAAKTGRPVDANRRWALLADPAALADPDQALGDVPAAQDSLDRPRRTTGLWSRPTPGDRMDPGTVSAYAALGVDVHRATAADTATDDLAPLRELFHAYRRDSAEGDRMLADAAGPLRVVGESLRAWFRDPQPARADSTIPFPVLARRVDPTGASLRALVSRPVTSLAGPVADIVTVLRRTNQCPSWVALYDDVCRWDDPAVRASWTTPTPDLHPRTPQ